MPVIGMIPRFIPTLMKTWNISMAAMPPAIMLPYKFFERVIVRSALQMSRAYSESRNAAPTKPKRSPTTAKMKSVWRSGRKPCCVWVASSPRPVLPPEPTAIRRLVDLIAGISRVVTGVQERGQALLLVVGEDRGSDGGSDHEHQRDKRGRRRAEDGEVLPRTPAM